MSKKTMAILKIVLPITLFAILVAIITVLLWGSFKWIFWGVYDSTDKPNADLLETHDVEDFFDKSYLEYKGGKDAEVFFNEYAYLEEYKDIAFHYKDNKKENRQFFFQYDHTAFALDVYYDEETFWEIAERILPEITGESAEECFKSLSRYDDYVGYRVKKEEVVYQSNTAVIFFDLQYNTIQYVFLYNETGDVRDAQDAMTYVLRLQRDWVLDYSDIEQSQTIDTTCENEDTLK